MTVSVKDKRLLWIIGITVAAALITRVLGYYRIDDAALFYIGTPFFISTALYWSNDPFDRERLGRHLGEASIVLLITSVILIEGFICFVFAAPIYYLAIIITFLTNWQIDRAIKHRAGRIRASVAPVLVALLSLEGVHAATTIDRENQATYSTVVTMSIAEMKANMTRPIPFDRPRHWFLSIFPKPVTVRAGSLTPGDVHELDFVYKKWVFTNTHQGTIKLRIEDVGEDFVRTRIVGNDSYLASYMTVEGTHVQFVDLGDGRTRATLTLFYQRKLDPVWYFGPLQRFAMNKSAQYILKTVIAREGYNG